MVETDVLSLALVCICRASRDTVDLESLSTHSLQAALPACLRNRPEVEGTGRGQGGAAGLCVRGCGLPGEGNTWE